MSNSRTATVEVEEEERAVDRATRLHHHEEKYLHTSSSRCEDGALSLRVPCSCQGIH